MIDEILTIWMSGGWVMVPLFGLGMLLYAQAFQLLLYLQRTDLSSQNESLWFDWVRNPDRAEGCVKEIIDYTQARVSSGEEVRNRFDEVRRSLAALLPPPRTRERAHSASPVRSRRHSLSTLRARPSTVRARS